jgi:hypothetical protein
MGIFSLTSNDAEFHGVEVEGVEECGPAKVFQNRIGSLPRVPAS